MEENVPKAPVRFSIGKQSSLAPQRCEDELSKIDDEEEIWSPDDIDPRVRLMYLSNEGDLEGIKELLDSGVNVNFRDIDDRTALHIAACQGYSDVVEYLLENGAEVDPKDRWGSTVYILVSSCSYFELITGFFIFNMISHFLI